MSVRSIVYLLSDCRWGKFTLCNQTYAAFSEELSLISRGKYRSLSEFGSQLQEERKPLQKPPKLVRVLSRELPSVRHPKKDKQRLPNLSGIGCPSISSSQAGENLSRRLSQRYPPPPNNQRYPFFLFFFFGDSLLACVCVCVCGCVGACVCVC